jgi:hypothetical protein
MNKKKRETIKNKLIDITKAVSDINKEMKEQIIIDNKPIAGIKKNVCDNSHIYFVNSLRR